MLCSDIRSLWLLSASAALRSTLSVTSAILACCASASLAACLYLDHIFSTCPSAFLTVCLAFSILFDGATAYLYQSIPGFHHVVTTTETTAAVKMVIMSLQELPKKAFVKDPNTGRPVNNKILTGCWTRTLHVWLTKTVFAGFQAIVQRRELDDLEDLEPEYSSELLAERFKAIWNTGTS